MAESERRLTDAERLVLINQYAILELLSRALPEDARRGGGVDHDPGAYAWRREALASGYDVLVDEAMDGVREPSLSRREQLDVLEILDMWSDLQRGFRSLEDRRGLTFEDVAFPGWDENGAKGELEFASLFCYREGYASDGPPSETPSRFVNVEPSPALGCGAPTTEGYYRMLEVYRPLRERLAGSMGRPFTHEEIRSVLAARKPPDGPGL